MNKTTQMIIDDLEQLAHDANAMVEATADIAGVKVEEARERLSAGINRTKEIFTVARRRTLHGSRAADVILHDHLYQVLAVGVIAGALTGFLLSARGACSRD
jgi:ElaB/YqjD/DUF883 family membrane-anchored ribosome-binding protein